MTARDGMIHFEAPEWISRYLQTQAGSWNTSQEKINLAIDLSRQNVQHRTGGPFGACVFHLETGILISAGVNLVPTSQKSIAHAEIVAVSLAQQKLGLLHLTGYELVSSCEPCAMCMASIPWAKISKLTYAASDEDARARGFNEGDKPENWRSLFAARGIEVEGPMEREKAKAVFDLYEGLIY